MVLYLLDWFGLRTTQDREAYTEMYRDSAADEAAMSECMSRVGFDYQPSSFEPDTYFAGPEMAMSAEDFADEYGLGVTSAALGLLPEPAPSPRSGNEYLESLTPGQFDAYRVASHSCADEIGAAEGFERVDAMNIAAPAYRTVVDSDERVVDALDEWRACLASSGFEFNDPAEMRLSFLDAVAEIVPAGQADPGTSEHSELERLFPRERQVAIVNVGCEAAFNSIRREVLEDRLDEFWVLFGTALHAVSTTDGPDTAAETT